VDDPALAGIRRHEGLEPRALDDIRDGVRTYLDTGVETLVLQSVGGEEDMPDFIRSVSNALIG